LKNRINSCLGRRTRRSLQLNTKQVELVRILFSIDSLEWALSPVLFALLLRSPAAIPVGKSPQTFEPAGTNIAERRLGNTEVLLYDWPRPDAGAFFVSAHSGLAIACARHIFLT
jgi:hypothetical protein